MPFELVKWGMVNGAEGIAFSGFDEAVREKFTTSYLHEVRQLADDNGLYLEWGNGQHVPMDLATFKSKEIFYSNRKAVGEAYALGVNIIRSCSGGLMRWKRESPPTDSILEAAAAELKKQASVFRDYGMVLAIETHFEFTTFELLKLFGMCDVKPGDWLGICLDTMNLLTMLEEPVAASERILPWIVSTHFKDGGILADNTGITTFPAPIGKGVIDLSTLIRMFSSLEKEIFLSVEDHGGSFLLPVNETWFIERFPDLPVLEYDSLLEMADKSREKTDAGQLTITDRVIWPSICEERTIQNIRNLKIIRDRIS